MEQTIAYGDGLLFLGSCFADEVGGICKGLGFDAMVNPFGVLYNPSSIAKAVKRLSTGEPFTCEEVVRVGEGYYCTFSHNTAFWRPSEDEMLAMVNQSLEKAHEHYKKAKWIIISLGTSWVFRSKATGDVVANCHKLPADQFERAFFTQGQSTQCLTELFRGNFVGPVEYDDNMFWTEFRDRLDEAVEIVLPLGIHGVENTDENVRKAKNAVEDVGIGRAFGAVGVRRIHENCFRQFGFRNGNDGERIRVEPPDDLIGIAHASDNGCCLARHWPPIKTSLDGILTATECVHERGLASSRTADDGNDGFGIKFFFKRVNVTQRLVERSGKILAVRPVRTSFKLVLELGQFPSFFRKTERA